MAALQALGTGDMNALRVAVDTAFCLGVRKGHLQSMNKPRPKAELVTRRFSPRSFQIFTTSADAAEWVKHEMPAYGVLEAGLGSEFFLVVAPTFDIEDVERYAESYNGQAKAALP